MPIAIDGVDTHVVAICSLLYMVKLHAQCYTWNDALCSYLYME